jgi:two-component system sensor histidine kinase PhoQ
VGGELISKPVNLTLLLNKTTKALSKVYQHKSLQIDLKVDEDILIRMDESDLLELLGNLIDNACKYGKSKVRIRSFNSEDTIKLQIEDDGNGLEPAQIEQILTRGIRLDQTKEGQGIGLSVVKEITNAYEIALSFNQSSLGGLKVELSFTNI